MKKIELSGKNGQGKFMVVDDQDFEKMNSKKWYINCHGYAMTMLHISGSHTKNNIVQRGIMAHRFVMDLTKGDGIVVDHKNGNRLDNTRLNLRLTNYHGNSWNTSRQKAEGEYIGVRNEGSTFSSRAKSVDCGNRTIHIGNFSTAKMAALAYDQFIRNERGEFAVLNFPDITDYSCVIRNPPKTMHKRSSTVKYVSYSHTRKAHEKWRVVIKQKHLGWFLTEDMAIEFLESLHENKTKIDNQT